MTHFEARTIAEAIKRTMPVYGITLKAIHVIPRLHEGMLTIRVFSVPNVALDPHPYVFNAEEL